MLGGYLFIGMITGDYTSSITDSVLGLLGISVGTGIQIAAWTVVLGAIFIRQVYRDLAMPEFGANLLALMGISPGTYLGLKITSE